MKRICLSLALLLAAATALAQSAYVNHDAEVLREVKGPVKEIVYTEGLYAPRTYAFDETGKDLKPKNAVTRDSHGYIVKEVSQGLSAIGNMYVYEYDAHHRLAAIKGYELYDGKDTLQFTVTYAYDAKGRLVSKESSSKGQIEKYYYNDRDQLVKTVASPVNGNGPTTVVEYTGIVTDEHGNWVRRHVDKGKKTYDEARTITYYED